MLYPLKFKPILKERIWGGSKLTEAGKKLPVRSKANPSRIGESWEISGLRGDMSVVANGFLKSNTLEELIEVYMGDLVGDAVYEKSGLEFPLLVKFIDAREVLSVQVHPDDEMARELHNANGKTEMWCVMSAEKGAKIYLGFKDGVTREQYTEAVEAGRVAELLESYEAHRGDIYFIPSGTVHALGGGVVVAEIQQSSDVTYRIDDWRRVDAEGNPRELHTELAAQAISFGHSGSYRISPEPGPDKVREVVASTAFNANVVRVGAKGVARDFAATDSFVICVCVEGECTVEYEGGRETLKAFESILIPAESDDIRYSGDALLLEAYIQR